MTGDRTVHGLTADGAAIVRYNLASKWFIEYAPERGIPRYQVNVRDAAELAREGQAFLGRTGGGVFDRAVGA